MKVFLAMAMVISTVNAVMFQPVVKASCHL